jgi:hypothetical protein
MINTDRYVIDWAQGHITCNYRREPEVRITTLNESGTSVVTRPYSQVFKSAALPMFTAHHLVGDEFRVDLDCGAQRWVGPQSASAVRAALRKCGVETKLAKKIVAEASKEN